MAMDARRRPERDLALWAAMNVGTGEDGKPVQDLRDEAQWIKDQRAEARRREEARKRRWQ
jgi:hypothetical protein